MRARARPRAVTYPVVVRHRSAIKPWALKLSLSLFAGAVVTWAVAWGCALWGQITLNGEDTWAPWPAGVPDHWPPPKRAVFSVNTWVTEWMWSEDYDETHRIAEVYANGLPFRAMKSTRIHDYGTPVLITSITAPEWMRPRYAYRWLPTQVLPLGFALNTTLAAVMVLGLIEGAAWARRSSRRRRGRCAWCAYDRGGLASNAACPECGGLR
jgi:hypothetical protein